MKIKQIFHETKEQRGLLASDLAKWLQSKAQRGITASTKATSPLDHGWYKKIVLIIGLIVAVEYSPFVIAGGKKERERKDWNQTHGTKQIPESTRRAAQGKLRDPRTDTRNGQARSSESVAPGYGATTMTPTVVQTPVVTREPHGQKLPPLKTREDEGSHHAHHQSHTCDEGSSKQGCIERTPLEQDLMAKKLRKE